MPKPDSQRERTEAEVSGQDFLSPRVSPIDALVLVLSAAIGRKALLEESMQMSRETLQTFLRV